MTMRVFGTLRNLSLATGSAITTLTLIGITAGIAPAAKPRPESEVDYRSQIWPIIQEKCLECHQAKKRQGSLDMSTRALMLKGGDSGPAFVPGNVEKSLMLELIEFGEMPPRKSNRPAVTKEEFQKLSRWVSAGAPVADEPDPPAPAPTP